MKDILQQILIQIRAGWRYRWYAMMIAWLVAILGWFVVLSLPDKFEANARVYVDTDSMLRPLLKGLAIQTNFTQRIKLMTKTLLSRPNLEKVARETDLDLHTKTTKEKEVLINKLRSGIKLQATRKDNLYTIIYSNNDPKLAKNVVQSLLTIFVETALGDTRQDSDTAQRFLDQQISEYESRLIKAENKLTEFKRQNVGSLPGQGGNVFQRLQTAEQQYAQVKLLLNEALKKRDEIMKQLIEAKATINTDKAPTTTTASPLDTRILALQQKLDDLLLKYTDLHPSVVELREKITILENYKKKNKTASGKPVVQINTLYEQTKLELGKSEAEIATLKVRALNYKNRLITLQKLVNILPKVETELKRLNRDYLINKQNYDALVSRRESAKMSQSANSTGDNVKFKVIDPPRLPVIPAGPKRMLLSVVILMLALVIGGGIAFILSQLNPVIYDHQALRKLTGLPVFGSVSRVWTSELLLKRRIEVGVFVASGIGLLFIFALVVFLQNYAGAQEMLKGLRGTV